MLLVAQTMRGVDVISPAIRVRIVKYAKCYFLSNNVNVSKMIRILSSLCRYRSTPDSANAMDIPLTYCTSLIGSFNVYNSVCLSNSRCTTYAAICDNTSHRSKYSGSLISLSNNVWRSVQVLGADYMPDRHLIHTSSLWSSDSLGTDSTGHDDSATSAKKQFEKWKASIDFDLLTESHMRIHNSHMKAVEVILYRWVSERVICKDYYPR